MSETRPMTFGERAVGITFNPSGAEEVARLKQTAAAFIDACDELRRQTQSVEAKGMYTAAIQEAQTAQMWSVKAATWRDE